MEAVRSPGAASEPAAPQPRFPAGPPLRAGGFPSRRAAGGPGGGRNAAAASGRAGCGEPRCPAPGGGENARPLAGRSLGSPAYPGTGAPVSPPGRAAAALSVVYRRRVVLVPRRVGFFPPFLWGKRVGSTSEMVQATLRGVRFVC